MIVKDSSIIAAANTENQNSISAERTNIGEMNLISANDNYASANELLVIPSDATSGLSLYTGL